MIQFLCEAAEKGKFSVNLTSIFTFIGMAFSIVVSLVALVWLTCFVVKLLVKTFKTQVQNSYDIFVENSTAKTQSKKERNAIKRKAKDARKMEILNLKQESLDRIHQMKVDKLNGKLLENENKASEKLGVNPIKIENKRDVSKEIKKLEEIAKEEKIAKEDKEEKTEVIEPSKEFIEENLEEKKEREVSLDGELKVDEE